MDDVGLFVHRFGQTRQTHRCPSDDLGGMKSPNMVSNSHKMTRWTLVPHAERCKHALQPRWVMKDSSFHPILNVSM